MIPPMSSFVRTRQGPRTGPGARLLALVVAASLATPGAALAAPAESPEIAEATEIYEQGIGERDAGNYVAAAESFTAAYDKIPATSREIRAAVLFDMIDARRNAYAEGEGPAQICECERRLAAYMDEIKAVFGVKGERFPDTRKAKKLLSEVRAQLEGLRPMLPDLDCDALKLDAPAPAPAPVAEQPAPKVEEPKPPPGPDPAELKRRRDLTIAGGALVGVGGVLLIVMAAGLGVGRKAERDGRALTDAASGAGTPLSMDDPAVQDAVRRGKLGNGLAIAGGVIGGLALAAGVSLLVVGERPAGKRRAGLTPSLAPGFAGAALHVRF